MDRVVDIVNAALDKDSIAMKTSLEYDLASRVADTIYDMRQSVATSLFGGAPEVEQPEVAAQEGSE